jgi:hypothetical protein
MSSVRRRLAAILSADVKGYSRLIDSFGDNLLVQFNSAANAVDGAVQIQFEPGGLTNSFNGHSI